MQPKLLVEMFVYLDDTEGTLYIPLEQHDHNWVVDHVKYNIFLECVQVYDNGYTWIKVFKNVVYLGNSEGANYIPFRKNRIISRWWTMQNITYFTSVSRFM